MMLVLLVHMPLLGPAKSLRPFRAGCNGIPSHRAARRRRRRGACPRLRLVDTLADVFAALDLAAHDHGDTLDNSASVIRPARR
jgi:hypothetical protein